MPRFVMLVKFTEIGISQIRDTVARAEAFRVDAAGLGVTVESLFWTLGEFDGVITLSAPDTETALALATHLAGRGYVRTCLLPAFSRDEFAGVLAKLPTSAS